MLKRRTVRIALVCIALVATACTDDKSGSPEALGSPACKAKSGERPAKVILRCTEASVAFVETEDGSGTGVVVLVDEKRYLLTNEHVIDPFDTADAVIAGRTYENLSVVGIDASADIALLGPLEGDEVPAALEIHDGIDLERGDDVFLVGFPGESDKDELEATIASGIVSRLRTVKEFERSYIQTDASIGDGQSGGPLFDSAARLVGISGVSFADEFALALTGRDVRTAAERIAEGNGDEYRSVPATARPGTGATSGKVRIFDSTDSQVLFLPAAAEDRTWHLSVEMSAMPIVTVMSLDVEPLAISDTTSQVWARLGRELAAVRGGKPDSLPDPSARGREPKLAERETASGRFTIPVKKEESAVVSIAAPLTDNPLEVAWDSDLSLLAASAPVTEKSLAVGGELDHIFGGEDTSLDVMVDLVEGQEVEIHARSPQGDPGFTLFDPSRKLDHLTMADLDGAGIETFDDTEDGLYGIDARTTFTPKTTGMHRIRLFTGDFNTVFVRLSVVDCSQTKCNEKQPEENKSGSRKP